MHVRATTWARLIGPLALGLLQPSAAHAQQIPKAAVWWAAAGLFAPFLAVPVKLGILRLLALEVPSSRLWKISAIEWVLWFPGAFFLLRYGPSSPPVVILLLLASVVWLHRARVPDARWSAALCLSLPTPVLAIALPFLAFVSHAFVDRLAA